MPVTSRLLPPQIVRIIGCVCPLLGERKPVRVGKFTPPAPIFLLVEEFCLTPQSPQAKVSSFIRLRAARILASPLGGANGLGDKLVAAGV
jgi:hypothetical protein